MLLVAASRSLLAPGSWATPCESGEYAGKVTLVGEAALDGDLGKWQRRRAEQLHRHLDAILLQPVARGHAGRRFEGLCEILPRQSAGQRDIRNRNVLVDPGCQELLGRVQLGRAQSSAIAGRRGGLAVFVREIGRTASITRSTRSRLTSPDLGVAAANAAAKWVSTGSTMPCGDLMCDEEGALPANNEGRMASLISLVLAVSSGLPPLHGSW
jgi:hypothetical protein